MGLSIVSLSNCSTLADKQTNPYKVSYGTKGAEVYVNSLKIGMTPVELDLKANSSYTIEYEFEGSKKITQVVNTKVGAGRIFLNVSGVTPVIFDSATANWKKLDQQAVNAVLEKQH